jgi:hypothetical protein
MLAQFGLPSAPSHAEQGEFPRELATAIVDARALAGSAGSSLWPGFADAHFGILLIEHDRELLACDQRSPDGFTHLAYDPVLNCDVKVGPRTWRTSGLQAAMPAFGPPSIIVMGEPSATGRSLGRWQLTLLHEHFHQWQSAQPEYYARVEALNLARGDQTGMWMLNYPFPYTAPDVQEAYAAAAVALAQAIAAPPETADSMFARYLTIRKRFAASVSADDWRYFEFQLWQEGVARWTELAIAQQSGRQTHADEGASLHRDIMMALQQPDLAANGRVSAYAMGAGEAMLLERFRPGWRSCYASLLALGPMLKHGCASQDPG